MSDDKSKVGGPDRKLIALNEADEIRDWTQHFGVSEEELRRAIGKVGHSADAVTKELGKGG